MQIFNFSTFRLLYVAIVFFSSMSFYGLQAQISSTTITINPVSVAATGASATSTVFTTGLSSTLSVQGGTLGTGAVWTWYADGCGLADSLGTGSSILISPTNVTANPITRTYFVRAEGVCNTTTCVQVTVTINPTAVIIAPIDAVYCAGDTIPAQLLVCTSTGIMMYHITGGANIGLADVNNVWGIPEFIATNNTNVSITSTITVTPSTSGTGMLPQSFTITVAPNVVMTSIANQILCNGTASTGVTVSSNMLNGVTYSWTNNTTSIGLAASGTGNFAPFTAVNNTCDDIVATITVTPTITNGSNNCEQTPVTFTFTVRPTPNGTLVSNNPICGSDPAMITFVSSCGTGQYGLTIRQDGITPSQGYTGITSGTPFLISPNSLTAGAHTFDLMVITDQNGCTRQ